MRIPMKIPMAQVHKFVIFRNKTGIPTKLGYETPGIQKIVLAEMYYLYRRTRPGGSGKNARGLLNNGNNRFKTHFVVGPSICLIGPLTLCQLCLNPPPPYSVSLTWYVYDFLPVSRLVPCRSASATLSPWRCPSWCRPGDRSL